MPSSQQPCGSNHHCPSPGCQVRLRLCSRLQPHPQSSPYFPVPGESWVGRALLTHSHHSPRGTQLQSPVAQEEIGKSWVFVTLPPQWCSTTPSTAPPLSTPSLYPATGPASPQTHIPADPREPSWVRAGASALFSPITVPRPHLRVLVHGSVRDNTTICICFLTLHHQEIGS